MNEGNQTMKIRFTYDGRRRSGELERFYHAQNGNLIAKVHEDGAEHAKSFRVDLMFGVESGPVRSDEELMPVLKKVAEKWLRQGMNGSYSGNPLELLIAAAWIASPASIHAGLGEALREAGL
jgi:hypothetical protein